MAIRTGLQRPIYVSTVLFVNEMREALQYVESKARTNWQFANSRRPLSRFYRFFSRVKPVQVVWISQHETGDWEGARCKGESIRSWRFGSEGFTSIDEIGEIDMSTISSATPLIRFCLDSEAKRMIYNEWHGVRAGFGTVLRFEGENGWRPERPAWRA